MNARNTVLITLDVIDVGDRLRDTDSAHVEQLVESMDRRGLRQPIELRDADAKGRHLLLDGAHRLAAARVLGWKAIEAFVGPADEVQAKLAEIEANLVRHDLSALDRAVFLAKWKELYSQLAGAPGKGRPKKDKGTNSSQLILPFSKAVHERLRMHPRSVNRAVARAAMQPDLRAAISHHPTAPHNESLLDLLVSLTAAQQEQIADTLTNAHSIGDIRRAANALRGKAPAARRDIAEAIIKLWAKATPEEKRRVREHISPRSGRSDV